MINKDYKDPFTYSLARDKSKPYRQRWLALVGGLAVLGAVTASVQHHPNSSPLPEVTLHKTLALPVIVEPVETATISTSQPQWREYNLRIGKGDTLASLLQRQQIARPVQAQIFALAESIKVLRQLKIGDLLNFRQSLAGELEEISYKVSETTTLYIRRSGTDFSADFFVDPPQRRVLHATGTVKDSLYLAGQSAGLSDNLIMELVGIFGWDVDFALDVRAGDRFSLVYEGLYRDGEQIGTGNILAAEYVNQGRSVKAIRFELEGGQADFFSPDGKRLRKAFLRSPLNFSRISSGFSLRRKHPILHKFRAHKGVDYAARSGTPVWSTGEGKIAYRATKGGYGKVVEVNHGKRYSTLYAHLSDFVRGQSIGKRVRQGEVIGFVGSTGLATGPHLHYEFRVNGVHRNPLTVRLPTAEPLPKQHQEKFQQQAKPLLAQLDVLLRSQLALME